MTTEVQKLLHEQASSKLFDSTGDRTNKDLCYYTGGLESLLAAIAKAAVADGVNARTVVKMLVRNAFQILDDPGAKPGDGWAAADLVVHEAQRLHSMRSTLPPPPSAVASI
jgi:protoporphyrinogen oxidase